MNEKARRTSACFLSWRSLKKNKICTTVYMDVVWHAIAWPKIPFVLRIEFSTQFTQNHRYPSGWINLWIPACRGIPSFAKGLCKGCVSSTHKKGLRKVVTLYIICYFSPSFVENGTSRNEKICLSIMDKLFARARVVSRI